MFGTWHATRGSFSLVRPHPQPISVQKLLLTSAGGTVDCGAAPGNYATAMAAVTSDRPLHLVVFGATGFTGGFVVEEVARRAADSLGGSPLKWAVAGRCRRRLEDVLNRAADRLCMCSGRPPPQGQPRSGRSFEVVTVRLRRPQRRQRLGWTAAACVAVEDQQQC